MPVGYSIYHDKPSPIHTRLDPRTKLLWLVVLFGVALSFSNAIVLGAFFVGLVIVGRVAKVRLSEVRGMALLSLWLMVLSVAIWPGYVVGGATLFTVGGFKVTTAGLLFGIAMGFRIDIMLLAATIWMITTSPQKLTAGMLAIGLPYKAGTAMALTLRFVPLMNAEVKTILEAQRARGLELARGNPIRRTVKAAALLVPLFTRAFVTVQNLTIAMDGRGFGARKRRTSILELQLSRLDWVLCGIGVGVFGVAAVVGVLALPVARSTMI